MRSRAILTGIQACLLVAALASGATPAFAVHDIGLFQLDRNATGGVFPNGPDDWDTVNCPPSGPCTTPANGAGGTSFAHTGFIPDPTPEASVFSTGGSKDNNDLSQWLWTTKSNLLSKDDISNAYAAAYTKNIGGTDHLILYFGQDRVANNGSAQVGFWFFQNPVFQCTTALSAQNGCTVGTFVDANGNLATHAVGDILIQSNFSGGGVISTVTVFEWVGSGGSNGALNVVFTGADCVPGTLGDPACGTVNQSNTSSPWPYTPKSGSPGTFPSGSFFEGGVDLTALGLSTCISTFMAETRSSTPFDSQLKDFVPPQAFNTCGITVTKGCTAAVNGAGTGVTVSVTGTVCNEGLQQVTGLTLSDVPTATLTPGSTTLGPKGSATECTNYSGSYTSTTAANSDEATASGSQGGETVTATAGAECTATITKGISVDKQCTAVASGNQINVSFSGQVCNTGNVALSGVSVSDSPAATITQPSSTLAPGGCSPYSGSYTSQAASNTDTITASATGALGAGAVSNTATATCTANVTPRVKITKQCSTALVLNGTTGHLEVKVTFSGQVCATDESGTVNSDVNLTGITVSNDAGGNSTGGTITQPSSTLAPGACSNYSGSYFPTSLPSGNGTRTDTVTVNANGAVGGGTASDTDTASCNLCPLP